LARKLGERWERHFGTMAASHGLVFTPHQIVCGTGESAAAYGQENGQWKTYLLPDVTVWTAPGEHHEIKHKERDNQFCYGLERYRLDALVGWANKTRQRVCYTIHDYNDACGQLQYYPIAAETDTPNDIRHWWCADILNLAQKNTRVNPNDTSLINGRLRSPVEVVYWRRSEFFRPLRELWTPPDIPRQRR
jgi:hypothetical protein